MMALDWIDVALEFRTFPPHEDENLDDPRWLWLRQFATYTDPETQDEVPPEHEAGTLYFSPGVYTIQWGTLLTFPSTINFVFEPGATLQLRRDLGDNPKSEALFPLCANVT